MGLHITLGVYRALSCPQSLLSTLTYLAPLPEIPIQLFRPVEDLCLRANPSFVNGNTDHEEQN